MNNDRLTARRVYGDALTSNLEHVAKVYRDLAASLTDLAGGVDKLGTPDALSTHGNASGMAAEMLRLIAYADTNSSLAGVVMRAAEYDRHVPADN